MSRIDKYDSKDGGFRGLLAEDFSDENQEVALGVGIDEDGHVVIGSGETGIVGVLVLTGPTKNAGHVVDVMTDGEIVEFDGDPGTVYYADNTTGEISSTSEGGTRVGHTVEGERLVVRMAR